VERPPWGKVDADMSVPPPAPTSTLACWMRVGLVAVLLVAPTLASGAYARALGQALTVAEHGRADLSLAQDSADALPAQAPLLVWSVPALPAPPEGPQDPLSAPPAEPALARPVAFAAAASPHSPEAPSRPLRHLLCVYRL
jgi:hypothetical protein